MLHEMLQRMLHSFDQRLSILKFLKTVIKQTFLFRYVELSEVHEEIMHLKTNSAAGPYGIPSKIIK